MEIEKLIGLGYAQHFTPLILLHWNDAKLKSELHEFDSSKRLRQNVSNLLVSPDMIDFDHALLNAVPDVVKTCIYVLTSIMEHGILGKLNS